MPYNKAMVPHFKTQRDQVMTCPYYRKVSFGYRSGWVNAYCEGDPTGKLQVPSLFEESSYCTTEQYADCPVFQVKQAQAEREGGPCTSAS